MKVPRHNSKSLKPYCHMFNQSEAIKLDISIHLMRNEEKKKTNSVIFDLRKNTTKNHSTDNIAFTSNDGDCALVACIIGLSAIRFPIAHKQQSHEIRWLTTLAFISIFMLPLFFYSNLRWLNHTAKCKHVRAQCHFREIRFIDERMLEWM